MHVRESLLVVFVKVTLLLLKELWYIQNVIKNAFLNIYFNSLLIV